MKKVLLFCIAVAAAIGFNSPAWSSSAIVEVFVSAGGTDIHHEFANGVTSASLALSALWDPTDNRFYYSEGKESVGLRGKKMVLKGYAYSEGGANNPIGSFSPVAETRVFGTWSDALTLTPPSGARLPDYLTFKITSHGILSAEVYRTGTTSYAESRVSFSGGSVSKSGLSRYTAGLGEGWIENGDWDYIYHGNGFFSINCPLTKFPDYGELKYQFTNGKRSLAYSGKALSNYYGTMQIDSILLPDGQTPESEGYILTFESGMASPNVVPLPGTGVLLFSSLLVMVAGRRRLKP